MLDGLSSGADREFWQADGRAISWDAAYFWIDGYCRRGIDSSPRRTVEMPSGRGLPLAFGMNTRLIGFPSVEFGREGKMEGKIQLMR
jgi:hypothetical protein